MLHQYNIVEGHFVTLKAEEMLKFKMTKSDV